MSFATIFVLSVIFSLVGTAIVCSIWDRAEDWLEDRRKKRAEAKYQAERLAYFRRITFDLSETWPQG